MRRIRRLAPDLTWLSVSGWGQSVSRSV